MDPASTIAFDADDTLWHNENAFARTEHWFNELVAPWADAATAQATLTAFERSHLASFGYGVKSFALSMVAAACDLSRNEIPAATLRRIVDTAQELITMPTVMIDGALDVLIETSRVHRTMIITKGDLHHQLRRLDEVGVSEHCFDVEVVADKDPDTYRRLLKRHQLDPDHFVMVGNSMVSDVLPVLEVGARAVHIPYEVTWVLERATVEPEPNDRWRRVSSITELAEVLASWR